MTSKKLAEKEREEEETKKINKATSNGKKD
jgi:hypothetical protein